VFDGNDYVIGFTGFVNPDPGGSNYIARISPSGAPDVRVNLLSFPDAVQPATFRLLRHQNKTYVIYDGPDGPTSLEKHIAALSPVDILEMPISIPAESIESIVTDGENIYSIKRESAAIYLVRLDLTSARPEVSTNAIWSGTLAYGSSVRDGFVIRWSDSQYQWHLAYFTHGAQQFSATVPFYPLAVVQSSNRLLAAGVGGYGSLPYGFRTFSFQTFELQTHETAVAERVLPWYLVLNIASAGADFFCTTERLSNGSILDSFWITDTEQPSFSAPRASDNAIKADLSLNPNRRYRIESSTNFSTWNLREVISGIPHYEIVVGGNDREFVRATLVPE
jgi:hypothetical protein